jgi:hypothetical protein
VDLWLRSSRGIFWVCPINRFSQNVLMRRFMIARFVGKSALRAENSMICDAVNGRVIQGPCICSRGLERSVHLVGMILQFLLGEVGGVIVLIGTVHLWDGFFKVFRFCIEDIQLLKIFVIRLI